MQSFFRVINIAFSPVLTLLFAARFADLTIAGRSAGNEIGGVAAGLLVLAVELALTQGPKHIVWLRRWLDPRAAFEGVWLQDVFEGPAGNTIAVFSLDYERDGDSFSVHGRSYSADGRRWAKWNSTHMFIDGRGLTATYYWKGEVLGQQTPETDKSGFTELELRRPPILSLPIIGEGRVSHVGERTRVKFELRRVTTRYLKKLGLPFTVRALRIDAEAEENKLVKVFLQRQVDR